MGRQRLTQRDLAAKAGWNPRYLSRRLLGEIPFTLEDLAELADVLKVSVVALVGADLVRTR